MTPPPSENETLLLGLDVGTQSTKALLYHPASSQIVARSSHTHTSTKTDPATGRYEQNPLEWIDAVTHCYRDLRDTYLSTNPRHKIKGVSVSGQQHGMVILDDNYRVLRDAKLWCDVEASACAKEYTRAASEVMKDSGGWWNVPPGFTAPKVMWLKRHEPEVFAKMRYCCLPHDYVTFRLCGGGEEGEVDGGVTLVTDAGDASGTGYFNPITREYERRLTEIINEGFAECLPAVLPAGAKAGELSRHWRHALGMTDDDGPVSIATGSGDNMCSALGGGCVPGSGAAVLSLGTSGCIFAASRAPPVASCDTSLAPFCDATGQFLPLACVMSCTAVLGDVLERCGFASHEEACERAEEVPPGCRGLVLLPYWGGERTPDWSHACGALLGITFENAGVLADGAVMYRCTLEGLSYALKYGLEQMAEACRGGAAPEKEFWFEYLLLVGGGSHNRLWRRILATVLEVELRFPLEAESAALGAAFQAGALVESVDVCEFVQGRVSVHEETVGIVREEVDIYREGYKRFKEYGTKLFA